MALRRLPHGFPEGHLKQPASLGKFLESQLCPWTSHLLAVSTLTAVSQLETKEAEGIVKTCGLLRVGSKFRSTALVLDKWNSKTMKAFFLVLSSDTKVFEAN